MKTVRYCCDVCERVERRQAVPAAAGGDDASARAAGWRIGEHHDTRIGVGPAGCGERRRIVICPDCAGTDDEYWDRQTLTVAYAAGIDAGNTAWGGEATT